MAASPRCRGATLARCHVAEREEPMKKSLILGMAAGAAGLALAGCFDVEQSVSLRRDLSRTAGFNMTVDLEPMIAFMAGMQHSMAGKPGDPTSAEIEADRKSTRLNSSHQIISYAVFCLKKKNHDDSVTGQEITRYGPRAQAE